MTLALVTDAATGLGLAVVERLADDHDFEVLLAAPSEDAARAATKHLWDHGLDSVHPRTLDPASESSIERLRTSIEKEFGHLDVLVTEDANVAGAFVGLLGDAGRIVDVSEDARIVALGGEVPCTAAGPDADAAIRLATEKDEG